MKFSIKQASCITQWVKKLWKKNNQTLKQYFQIMGELIFSPATQLSTILFILNFLTVDAEGRSPMEYHTQVRAQSLGWVHWKDLQTGRWKKYPCWYRWGGLYVFFFQSWIWVPEQCVQPVTQYEHTTPLLFLILFSRRCLFCFRWQQQNQRWWGVCWETPHF